MSADSSSPIRQPDLTKLQRRLVDCYEQGFRLMDSEKNHDYAHMMFAECVLHDPANLTYAEALLRNLRAKCPKPTKKLPFVGHGGSRSLRQAVDAKDRTKIFRLGIELLKSDPWDISTLRLLAEACGQFHYNEVELVYLKQAIDANPKDIETNRHCALSLARMGQFDQAIACWHRIETTRPRDKEAPRMIVQLSEEKRKYPGGRPPMGARQPGSAPGVSAKESSSEEATEALLSPRQRLEQAIADNPQDVSNYLELADLLALKDLYQEAESTLMRGMAACGEQPELKNQLAQIRTLRFEQEQAAAEARRKAELKRQQRPFRMPWLEAILALAALALALQLFPPVAAATWQVIDVRQWSRTGWLIANIGLLGFLFFVRLWPLRTRNAPARRRSAINK